jgi:hypothetical protein
MSSMLDRYPQRDGMYQVLPDAVTVHDRYRNRMVKLDPFASEIWLRIDGITQLRAIASDIAGRTSQPLETILRNATAMTGILIGEGLAYLSLEPQPLAYHLAVPQEDQDPARAEASMRAAGWLSNI